VTGKKRTQSTTSIQVEGQGSAIIEHTTQEAVKQIIFLEAHEKQYVLAGNAPICNGELLQDMRYTANAQNKMQNIMLHNLYNGN
jgi:hypothetical protein